MGSFASLYYRSRQDISNNGFLYYLFRILRVIVFDIIHFFFVYRTWYVYEHDLHKMLNKREEYFIPPVPNLTHKVIKNVDEARVIARQGYDLLDRGDKVADKLLHGAIAFCVFYGTKLMHIGWLCMTEEARNSVELVPYRIDFSRMASIEGSKTMPEFRSKITSKNPKSYKGLMAYTYFKRAQYLIKRDIFIARFVVLEENTPSQKIMERFGARKISSMRMIKILGLKFWRENPDLKPDVSRPSFMINSKPTK